VANLAGSSKLLRAMNCSAALALLFERGRLTRGELRDATGLAKPTVSDAMRRLVEENLAVVAGQTRGGPGPNADIYAVNPDAAHVVAVSVREGVSGAHLAAARCDLAGTVRAALDRSVDLRGDAGVEVVAAAVAELGRGVPGRLAQVRLGVAGAVDRSARVIHRVDLPGFGQPGLLDALADRLGVPLEVDNDVNLATVAERTRGCARGVAGFALLWLGEGVGLGIDLGTALLRGAHGAAGEIGYLPLPPAWAATGADGADLRDLLGGPAVRALAAEHLGARTRSGRTGGIRPAVAMVAGTSAGSSAGRQTARTAGTGARASGPAARASGPAARPVGPAPRSAVAATRAATRTNAKPVGPDVLDTALADDAFLASLADRIALAVAAAVTVLDPGLLVLAGPVARAGGAPLRDAVVAALARTVPLDVTVELTTVDDDPVVVGGLDAALAAVREGLVTALRTL
jgi:predicted NBD/HSP70 family sugar kinase